jgi:hypothetical protein
VKVSADGHGVVSHDWDELTAREVTALTRLSSQATAALAGIYRGLRRFPTCSSRPKVASTTTSPAAFLLLGADALSACPYIAHGRTKEIANREQLTTSTNSDS